MCVILIFLELRVRFTCDSVIQGYHMYKEIWDASCGQVYRL